MKRLLTGVGICAAGVILTAAVWNIIVQDLNDHITEAVEAFHKEIASYWHSANDDPFGYDTLLDSEDGYDLLDSEDRYDVPWDQLGYVPLGRWVY